MRIQMNDSMWTPLRTAVRVLVAASVFALSACGETPGPRASSPPPKLEAYPVSAAGAVSGRDWDGVVEAVRNAVLSAQTGGRVAAALVDVGDRVRAGQVLLRLTVVEQQAGVDAARAQLRAAEAAATEAERTYQRFLALAKDAYVSRAQLDQVRAARDAANAARDAARAQVSFAGQNADYTTVRAPFDGIVATRAVDPGETVAPGQALLSVYAPDELRVEVRVPQSEADAIRARPQARVRFDDGREVDARSVIVYPSADPASHSVPVRAVLPRIDAPPAPGSTAKVSFPLPGVAKLPRVPEAAVLRRGELTAVYVLKDGRPMLRQVRLGESDADSVEVLAGLRSGEIVARDPEQALLVLQRQRAQAEAAHE